MTLRTANTASAKETVNLGRSIGEVLPGGAVLALIGPLGAGKTQFVKGLALGVGAPDDKQVTSPTFTLIQEYSGNVTLYHIDAYRLGHPSELAALGFDELIHDESIVVVEWADRVRSLIPPDSLHITIEPTGETVRRFHFATSNTEIVRSLEAVEALEH